MVCRLFFTRWWISRMVASFDSSRRSRRRRSVTSRSSTQHADDAVALELRDRLQQQRRLAPLDLLGDRAAGRGWRRRPRPGRSPSPRGGAPTCTSGCRGGASSSPRWGWRSAPGGRGRGRSRRRRRAGRPRTRRRPGGTGSVPSAIIAAKRSNGRQVVLLELAELAAERRARLRGDHGDHRARVAHRDALHVRALRRPEQRRVALDDLAGAERPCHQRAAPPRRRPRPRGPSGRRSGRWSAAPGRAPPTGCRPPPRPARAAAGRRSRGRTSACHDAASRWTWRSDSPQSAVFVRACSKNVVTEGSYRRRRAAKRHLADAREPGDVGDVGVERWARSRRPRGREARCGRARRAARPRARATTS